MPSLPAPPQPLPAYDLGDKVSVADESDPSYGDVGTVVSIRWQPNGITGQYFYGVEFGRILTESQLTGVE